MSGLSWLKSEDARDRMAAVGMVLSALDQGRTADVSDIRQRISDRKQNADLQQQMTDSGVLDMFTPQQRKLLSALPPTAATRILAEQVFQQPDPMAGINMERAQIGLQRDKLALEQMQNPQPQAPDVVDINGIDATWDAQQGQFIPIQGFEPQPDQTAQIKNYQFYLDQGFNQQEAAQLAGGGTNIFTGDVTQSAANGVVSAQDVMPSELFDGKNTQDAVGLPGAVTTTLNSAAEAIMLPQPGPRVDAARKALESLSTRTMLGMSEDFPGRPSNLTRERIEALTVKPGEIRSGPQSALNKTRTMIGEIESSIEAANAVLLDNIYSREDKATAKTALRRLSTLLGDYRALEQSLHGQTTPSQAPGGQNRTSNGVSWSIAE